MCKWEHLEIQNTQNTQNRLWICFWILCFRYLRTESSNSIDMKNAKHAFCRWICWVLCFRIFEPNPQIPKPDLCFFSTISLSEDFKLEYLWINPKYTNLCSSKQTILLFCICPNIQMGTTWKVEMWKPQNTPSAFESVSSLVFAIFEPNSKFDHPICGFS